MIIGVTGGVGAGKSKVLSIMERDFHAKILLADDLGHRVMEPGTEACLEIGRTFPGTVSETGVDRNRLSAIVYADSEKLRELNAIIHPRVLYEIEKILRTWQDQPLVVLETAILFETGCHRFCHRVWGVTADREVRIRRLMTSRGYTREKAEAIMSRQMSEETLAQKCDQLIINNGNCEDLEKQIKYLLGIEGIL